MLSVSGEGGNEAILSCLPCPGSPWAELLDRMESAEIGGKRQLHRQLVMMSSHTLHPVDNGCVEARRIERDEAE